MTKDIATLFEDYTRECEYSRRLRPETLRGYREVFQLFQKLMPEISDPALLSDDIMSEFFKRTHLRSRKVGKDKVVVGLRDSTIRTYWSKLFSFFNWLLIKKIIEVNPLTLLKPPKVEYVDDRALSDEELHKIIAAITLHPQSTILLRRDIAMFYVLLFCGLRKNELISLRVTDIDLEKRELFVRAETSKSRKTRLIPLHPTLGYHLKEYFKERKKCRYTTPALWVNSKHDSSLTNHGLKHWVIRLIKFSGVKFHLHQFRHSFACALAKKDVSVIKIQKLMGHADITMTMTYVRSISTQDLRNDIGKLSF
jgi:integrase